MGPAMHHLDAAAILLVVLRHYSSCTAVGGVVVLLQHPAGDALSTTEDAAPLRQQRLREDVSVLHGSDVPCCLALLGEV